MKLDVKKLKRIIAEEKKKLKSKGLVSQETKEDSWSGGDNLVNKIDYIKKLGIQESAFRRKADALGRLRRKLHVMMSEEV
jgi:hypothetical protein|tara:strand:+ start:88812 stop:89051 length:240 start_codon:yes stop_codon:yes gene_type:complete